MWTSLHSFYCSDEWLDFRVVVIAERLNICEDCRKYIKNPKELQVHHITELTLENVNDYNISLNKDNVKVLCHSCHDKKHRRFGSYQRKVYVVYGPPLAGKKTLVSQLFKTGDIILDMDYIFQCISGEDIRVKPNNLRFNAFKVRDTILDMIKTRYGKWIDAYIIGGYAEKYERERLANELGAEIIYCEATKEECYARALALGNTDYYQYIDNWFNDYST